MLSLIRAGRRKSGVQMERVFTGGLVAGAGVEWRAAPGGFRVCALARGLLERRPFPMEAHVEKAVHRVAHP